MTITTKSPYQIFKKNELPASWESGFQDNLSNYPLNLQPQLKTAWQIASRLDFPSRKDESWRWMDYKELDWEGMEINPHDSPIRLDVHHVREDEEQKAATGYLPNEVVVTTLRELIASNTALASKLFEDQFMVQEGLFAALPSALANDGLVVYVPRGVNIEGVVQCYL